MVLTYEMEAIFRLLRWHPAINWICSYAIFNDFNTKNLNILVIGLYSAVQWHYIDKLSKRHCAESFFYYNQSSSFIHLQSN